MKKNIEKLISLLNQKELTISTCESATGGFLASTFTMDNPGVSSVYKGGLVTYCNEAKVVLASVPAETINKHTAISEETAEAMAANTAKLLNTEIAISVTGNAGPSGSENQNVGIFHIGISILGHTNSYKLILQPSFSRKKMIQKVADYATEITIKSII